MREWEVKSIAGLCLIGLATLGNAVLALAGRGPFRALIIERLRGIESGFGGLPAEQIYRLCAWASVWMGGAAIVGAVLWLCTIALQ
jgi:hypothetical protein